jgi:hypothetical protein
MSSPLSDSTLMNEESPQEIPSRVSRGSGINKNGFLIFITITTPEEYGRRNKGR